MPDHVPMIEPETRGSVDFEPVTIHPPGRRRRPDPAVVGSIVVAVALLVAIVKPWEAGRSNAPASAAPAVRSQPPGSAGVATAAPSLPSGDRFDPATASAFLSALDAHDAWGIRVLTHRPASSSGEIFAEEWQEASPTDVDQVAPLLVTDATPVAFIGITAPLDTTPLDVRAWARGHDGAWHWLDVRRLRSDLPAADLLLPPPVVDGSALVAWPPGRYRFDLLMGADVTRIDLTVDPDEAAADAPISSWAPSGRSGPVVWPADAGSMPYVVVAGVVEPLAELDRSGAEEGPPSGAGPELSVADAWLQGDRVVSVWRPRASGLGVLLPVGVTRPAGIIRRLAPHPIFGGPVAHIGVHDDVIGYSQPFVEFDAAAGDRVAPGGYAMELAWTTASGRHTGRWYVELRPGPAARSETSLLSAARRYAAHGGRDGLVVGSLDEGTRLPAVSAFPLADLIGCDGPPIDQLQTVLGLTHLEDQVPDGITAIGWSVNQVAIRPVDVPVRIASAAAPGLTLIAPARDAFFAPGIYRFTVELARGSRVFTVCLGGGAS